jgi:hypothetical protein
LAPVGEPKEAWWSRRPWLAAVLLYLPIERHGDLIMVVRPARAP